MDKERFAEKFTSSFTRVADDWELFFSLNDLDEKTARKIEQHIKSMKSRIYIKNLTKYPDIIQKLLAKYS